MLRETNPDSLANLVTPGFKVGAECSSHLDIREHPKVDHGPDSRRKGEFKEGQLTGWVESFSCTV